MKTPIGEIFDAIIKERKHQDEKWGSIEEHPHTVREWIAIMKKEVEESEEAYFDRPADPIMLSEVLQAVAVGVACLEQHGFFTRETLSDLYPEPLVVRSY